MPERHGPGRVKANLITAGALPLALAVGAQEELTWREPLVALRRRGWPLSTLVTLAVGGGVAFGATHYEMSTWNALSAGLAGGAAGWLTLASKSLWPAVFGHALYSWYVYLRMIG